MRNSPQRRHSHIPEGAGKHTAAILLIMTILLLPSTLFANGAVFTVSAASDVSVPGQEALAVFDGSEETLVLSVRFEGEGKDFAWIVPVPSRPEVQVAGADLFSLLEITSKPRVVVSESFLFFGTLGLLAFLAILFPVLAIRRAVPSRFLLAAVIAVSYIFAIGVPNFMSMRHRGGAPRTMSGVTVHERSTIGPYDIAVLSSIDSQALTKWLSNNGYFFPEIAIPVFDDYSQENWFFVAARLSSQPEEESADWKTTPLRFRFSTEELVYPMKLTALVADKSDVLLYVLGNGFYRAKHLKVESRTKVQEDLRGHLEEWLDMRLDSLPALYLTRLYGSLSPAQMREDLSIAPVPGEKESRSIIYSTRAKRYLRGISVACLVLISAYSLLPVPVWKKIPFVYLALAALVLLRPWDLSVQHSREYEERKVGMMSVKSNMHTLQLALQDFSSTAQGYYPADLNIQVREVLAQLGIDSDDSRSVAGTQAAGPIFEGQIGSGGPALLPPRFRHPDYQFRTLFPALVTSTEDPPRSFVSGVTYYVPLDVSGNLARRYRIYAGGKDSLLALVLSSEE